MKIVLWYSNQSPRFAYDLHRFRQVWYIVLQMEANGFDLKRSEPKVFNDVLVMLFYCVDSAKGEINWDMVHLITHEVVSPLLKAYLAEEYEQIRCTDHELWVDVWAEDYVVPHQIKLRAMHNNNPRYSYAGLFDYFGITPFNYELATVSQSAQTIQLVKDEQPGASVSIARSSAGMPSLVVLWSLPISQNRAFLLPNADSTEYDTLGKLAMKVSSSMPDLLQHRWSKFPQVKGSSEGRPLEEVYEDQEDEEAEDQEGDETEEQEAVEPEDQEESGPEDGKKKEPEPEQAAAEAAAKSEASSELNLAQDPAFSAAGMGSLNRDEAVQKIAATTAKDGLSTPAKPQSDSKKPADGDSTKKGNSQQKAARRTPGTPRSK